MCPLWKLCGKFVSMNFWNISKKKTKLKWNCVYSWISYCSNHDNLLFCTLWPSQSLPACKLWKHARTHSFTHTNPISRFSFTKPFSNDHWSLSIHKTIKFASLLLCICWFVVHPSINKRTNFKKCLQSIVQKIVYAQDNNNIKNNFAYASVIKICGIQFKLCCWLLVTKNNMIKILIWRLLYIYSMT